ncbi:MAG: hypothetical protein HRT73_07165, partial [Flavobacteriales bacterium]|nr:hypothetical protein [Flavobacteriales bacterium]
SFLIKTDLNGNFISEHTFGGVMEEEGIDIITTNDGNFILIGSTTSSGAGEKDIHVIKIDSNGNIIWENTYGGSLNDTPQEIIELSNAEFCIAATTESFGAGSRDIYMVWIDQNGNLLREKTHGGIDIDGSAELLEIDNQEIMFYGYTYNYGAGGRDLYLLKTNFVGDSLWSKAYGGSGYEESQAFSKLSDGGYLLCGHSSSTDPNHNMYGVKTSVNGTQIWDVNFGGSLHDGGQALLINSDGNYIFIGRTMSFGSGMRDAMMVITNPNGQEISTQYWGGTLNDQIDDIIEYKNFYYLVGQSNSFGNGDTDIYLIKVEK